MMRRALIAVLFAVFVISVGSPALAQDLKLGVFDSQRVSEETAEGVRIQEKLGSFRNEKQAELTGMEEYIGQLQSQLQTQALSLSSEKKSSLENEIQRKIIELNAAREAAGRELQLEIAEAQNQFQEKLYAVVEKFGRDEGFAILFDRSLVAWSAQSVDVTTAVVDLFNQMFPVAPDSAATGGGQ